MEAVILIFTFSACVLLIFLVYKAMKDAPQKTEVVERLLVEKATLEADLNNERRISAEKISLLRDAEIRLKTEFENIANKIFEEKGKKNNEQIIGLLNPFKEQLDSFRRRVDDVHKDNTEQSTRLLEQVRQLQDLSNKVSDEANMLAKAIKGDTKKQGDWGQIIVERVFESSGLQYGREYEKQTGLRTADGDLQKPDFIVYLPGQKAVIVDSKVSLTAYDRFVNADRDEDSINHLNDHIKSVRKHVDELKDKNYQDLLGNRTLDFVLMCIPIEPAYQAAMQADQALIYDFTKTNVVITGPTTLMITLKLIAQIWRRENENKNAEVIADKAGKIYDQVVLIAEAALDAQSKLQGTGEAFDLVLKRLKDGKGNLIGRVEEIRRLGAKANKQLPQQ